MELRIAERKKVRIKMALQGPSGSGKTMGSLFIAYGLCPSWAKIAVIDSENHSASLYAHLGRFLVVDIVPPFSPEKYIEAIRLCERAGIEVIIIDSISHEWEGAGGILETHGNMPGNSFTNWSKITPRHNAFVQAILQSPAHIVATIRSKQEYVLSEKNGKQVPEKVGMKGVTREGMDYEFTIVLDMDMRHYAAVSKDRTGLFMGKQEFTITAEIGKTILDWCNQEHTLSAEDLSQSNRNCGSLEDLSRLYFSHPQFQQSHATAFTQRKRELMPQPSQKHPFITSKIVVNGTSNQPS